jgi:hypothetical protein
MECVTFCALLVPVVSSVLPAQELPPIIDMHLHALAADDQGPPPVAICTPINPFPAWDPAESYGATFMRMLNNPACRDPITMRRASSVSASRRSRDTSGGSLPWEPAAVEMQVVRLDHAGTYACFIQGGPPCWHSA